VLELPKRLDESVNRRCLYPNSQLRRSRAVPSVVIFEREFDGRMPGLVEAVKTQAAISTRDTPLTTAKLVRPLVASVRREPRNVSSELAQIREASVDRGSAGEPVV